MIDIRFKQAIQCLDKKLYRSVVIRIAEPTLYLLTYRQTQRPSDWYMDRHWWKHYLLHIAQLALTCFTQHSWHWHASHSTACTDLLYTA